MTLLPILPRVTRVHPVPCVAAHPCTSGHGFAYCVTHDASFATPAARDAHVRVGEHELAWICPTHGPEAA